MYLAAVVNRLVADVVGTISMSRPSLTSRRPPRLRTKSRIRSAAGPCCAPLAGRVIRRIVKGGRSHICTAFGDENDQPFTRRRWPVVGAGYGRHVAPEYTLGGWHRNVGRFHLT